MRYRFGVIVGALLLVMSASVAQAAGSIGVVGALTGTATATSADGKTRNLTVGDAITREDMLATAAGSKMQLMLEDQSTITLNPNSKMKVSEFAFDASANDGAIKMDALKGAFRFIGGAVSKNRDAVIKTPVSSIGIRGSIGDTTVGPNGETNAVFASGSQMSMTNANGETTTTTSFGTGFSMQTPNDTPAPMSPSQIQSMSRSFASAAPVAGNDGGAEGGDNEGAAETTGNDSAASDNDNADDGGDAAEGGDNEGADAGAEGNDAANADGGESGAANDTGDAAGTDAGAADAGAADAGAAGTGDGAGAPPAVTGENNAVPNVNVSTNEVASENQRVDTVNNLSGNDPDAFNNPESVRSTIQNNIDSGADASGTNSSAGGTTGNTAGAGGAANNGDNTSTLPRLFTGLSVSTGLSGTDAITLEITDISDFFLSATNNTVAGQATIEYSILGNNVGDQIFTQFPVIIPGAAGGSFFDLTPASDFITLGNKPFDLQVFRSISGLTQYITFQQIGDGIDATTGLPTALTAGFGQQQSVIIGRDLPVGDEAVAIAATTALSQSGNTGNITYYGFLPDLNNHLNSGIANGDGISLFNYGHIDNNGAETSENNLAQLGVDGNTFGVAVDWQNEQFFSGFIRWGSNAEPEKNYDTVAFGNVDTSGTLDLFDGGTFTLYENSSLVSEGDIAGDLAGVFVDDNNVIEAFVMQGAEYSAMPSVEDEFYMPAFRLDTQGANAPALQAIDHDQTAGATTLKGFTAGFVELDVYDIDTSNQIIAMKNDDINNFIITKDSTGNSVDAHIDIDGMSGVTHNFQYNFGGANAESVYLSDDIYAAELNQVIRTEAGMQKYNADNATTDGLNAGFIANATAISDIPGCGACEYVHWGVWAAHTDAHDAGLAGSNPGNFDAAHTMPYVAGDVMDAANFATYAGAQGAVDVTYTGVSIGNVNNSGVVRQVNGGFTGVIDMGMRALDSVSINMDGGNVILNGTAPIVFGDAVGDPAAISGFAVNGSIDSVTGVMGTLNAAMFGPQAENIGGNFQAQGTNVTVGGVYLGAR